MTLRKTILPLMLVSSMLLTSLAGCGGGNTPAADPGAAPAPAPAAGNPAAPAPEPVAPVPEATNVSGYDFTACIASEPETIDPQLNIAVDGAVMSGHAFEGIMKWADDGSGNTENAKLVNGQIESYEKVMNGEKAVYTFKLRDDIFWTDNVPVTSYDFEYTWRRLANPDTAADYSYMIDMVDGFAEVQAGTKALTDLGVKAIDDRTLEITLFFDCPYFLEVCAFPATFPVRQDIIEAHGDQWTFSPATFVTNGAYKLKEWEHNSHIIYEKNPTYYDYANLGPDTITFRLMDDANAMLAAFRSGDLDFIEQQPVDEIPALLAAGEITIADYIGTYYIDFNNQKAPFDNPLVRKAFTLAIDRNYIISQITRTGQMPASGFVPSGMYDKQGPGSDFRTNGGDYYSLSDADYQASCEAARAALAEAGYPGGAGFPTVEYLYNTDDNHRAIGEALQQMWKTELGVDVTLQNEEWGTFLQTRQDGNYELARDGWIGDYNDPITFLDMFHSESANNNAQFKNAEYDDLVRVMKGTSDPDVRFQAMHDAEDLMIEQNWAISPLYFYTNKWMIKSDVSGMYYTPLGYMFFSYIKR